MLLSKFPIENQDQAAYMSHAYSVTPDDAADLSPLPRALWVGVSGGDGLLTVIFAGETNPVTLSNVQSGTWLDIMVRRVMLTDTEVSDIVAMY